MARHFLVPDTQVRPGVPTDHIDWIAQAIVDYRPDFVCHIGDHWDCPSLSMHDGPGSMKMEGARYEDDVAAGNDAFSRLCTPMEAEQARLKRNKEKQWNPRCVTAAAPKPAEARGVGDGVRDVARRMRA